MKIPNPSAFPATKASVMVLITGLFPIAAHGATYIRTATGDWATLAEWNDDSVAPPAFAASTVLPGLLDSVILNQDTVTDVTTAIGAVGAVQVSNTESDGFLLTTLNIGSGGILEPTGLLTVGAGSDTGTLNVLTGGTLTATGGISLSADPSHSFNVMGGTVTSPTGLSLAGGEFNLSSGTVTLTDPSPGGGTFDVMTAGSIGVLNVTGGDFVVAGATGGPDTIAFRGEINISDGTFSAVGGQAFGVTGTVFNITGDDAVINIDRFNNANAGRATEINFEFDPTGVSPITCGNYMTLTQVTVNVDGSNYTGGPAVINLMTSPNSQDIPPLAATVTAPFPGLESVISLAGDNLVVTLSIPGTTWDGSDDLTWTGPSDSTSWSGETFTNGDSATFGDIGFGPVTISGAVETSGVAVNNTTPNDYTFSGDPIGGTFGLSKNGTGRLFLDSANTYTGVTAITGGQIRISNADALGSTVGETIIQAGTKLELVGDLTIAEPIISQGGGNGKLTSISGTQTFTGLITSEGNLDVRGADYVFQGGFTSANNSNVGFNGARYTVDTTPISIGTGRFSVTSAGTLANATKLNVAGNTWGNTRLSFGGYLLVGVADALNTDTPVSFGHDAVVTRNAGTLDINGFDQTVGSIETTAGSLATPANNQNITDSAGSGTLTVNQGANDKTYVGRFTGGVSLTKNGEGILTLNNTSGIASSNTGSLTVNEGVVESLSGSDFSDTSSIVLAGGTLNLNYVGTDQVVALDLGSGPVVDGEYGAVGSVPPIIEDASITGTGTLTVSAPPAGPIAWNGSTNTDWTNPDSDSWSGDTYNDGDAVSFIDANASPVTISGTVAPGSVSVNSTFNYTFSGDAISGVTGLTKSGTGNLTLASANTYTGDTLVSEGVLTVPNAASLGTTAGITTVTNGGAVSIEGGIIVAETLSITGTGGGLGSLRSNGNNTVSGAIITTGARIETVDGTGKLILTGGITGTGNILVGDIQVDSLIDIGANGMSFAGSGINFANPGFDHGNVIDLNVADNIWSSTQLFFDANVRLGVSDAIAPEATMTFGFVAIDNSTVQLDLNGFDQRLASIRTHTLGVGGDVNITGGGTLTLTQDTDTEYQGRITDGATATTLEKEGAGILRLNNLSGTPTSYTGDTCVFSGTLVLSSADLADGSTVEIFLDGTLQLDHGGVDVVSSLYFDGAEMPAGTYTMGNSNGFITGSGAIQVGGGSFFDSWVADFPDLTDSDPSLDFDGGGLETGVEYVVGGDPTDSSDDSSLVPTSSVSGSDLLFEFRRTDLANDDSNTTIVVEYGNSLMGWTTASDGVGGVTITVTEDGFGTGIDRVVVSLPTGLAMNGKLFARLNVAILP